VFKNKRVLSSENKRRSLRKKGNYAYEWASTGLSSAGALRKRLADYADILFCMREIKESVLYSEKFMSTSVDMLFKIIKKNYYNATYLPKKFRSKRAFALFYSKFKQY